MTRRGITIVVPVFADLPSIERCIAALVRLVKPGADRVLIVNDAGPDIERIEARVQELIAGRDGFRYERNSRNLGFVATCNRAATQLDDTGNDILLLNSDAEPTEGFLDELSAVLHESARHGIVCPRSDNATIASLPHRLRDPSSPRTPQRTLAVHEALRDALPRYSISPVSMGFCFLVRRELIEEHGLFDEVFSPGYGEENDFCLRMNAKGYLSLIAHRVVVFHEGSRSFQSERRRQLRAAHEKLLVGRHPFYTAAVRSYLQRHADPVDVFADALAPTTPRRHILIDLSNASGRVKEQQLSELVSAAARSASSGRLAVTIAAPERLRRQLPANDGVHLVEPSHVDGLFDVGVAWLGDLTLTQLLRLNRDCLRWAFIAEDPAPAWSQRVADPRTAALDDDAIAFAAMIAAVGDEAAAGVRSRQVSLGLGSSARVMAAAQFDAARILEQIIELSTNAEMDPHGLRVRWRHWARVSTHAVTVAGVTKPPRVRWIERLDRRLPRVAHVARRAVRLVRRLLRRR